MADVDSGDTQTEAPEAEPEFAAEHNGRRPTDDYRPEDVAEARARLKKGEIREVEFKKAVEQRLAQAAEKERRQQQGRKRSEPKPRKEVFKPIEGESEEEAILRRAGFVRVDGKLVKRDRANFREYQNKQRARLDQKRQEAIARVQQRRQQAAQRIGGFEEFRSAKSSGNYDKILRALGYDGFDDFAIQTIKDGADPTGRAVEKEVLELKREIEAEKSKKREQEQRAEQQRAQAQQEQNRNRYREKLTHRLAESKEPLLTEFHDVAAGLIMAIQEKHWDGETTISPEACLSKPAHDGAELTLREYLESFADLAPAFGLDAEPDPAPLPTTAPRRQSAGSDDLRERLGPEAFAALQRIRKADERFEEKGWR